VRQLLFAMGVSTITASDNGPRDQRSPQDMEGLQLLDGTTAVVRSPALRHLMTLLQRVAQHKAAVLIVGETGSGKELVARAVHYCSRRCARTFVDVNCAALPEHLVESELFGYEKGAFSGAENTKAGLFELADGGTLFLDEVGELDPKVQVKLLRILDGVPYYRLGGNRKISVDVRIVAATNQDMEAAVRSGKFRRDLFYRLSQFQLLVPPLRERPEDIVAIAEHILHQHYANSHFAPDALQALRDYGWPGNVRELKNLVFKAVMHAENAACEVRACDLPFENGSGATRPSAAIASGNSDLNGVEKRVIFDTLARTGGHRGRAAEQLGVSRRTLSRKLKLYQQEAQADRVGRLGALSYEQQRYFRVVTEFPVIVRCGDKQAHATSVNLSSSGIALRSPELADFPSTVTLSFNLPATSLAIETKAQLAWIDAEGRAGFRFVDMTANSRQELESWLDEQITTEGWLAEPTLIHHL
jgi:DNA-binding NtrC family response regulator